MNLFKSFILMSVIIASSNVCAKDEEKSIDQMLNSLKLEKLQAEVIIEKMKSRGRMNSDEASFAKREIASVKEKDEQVIKAQALESLPSKHSFATK